MNPFDLPGPAFLFFYILFSIGVFILTRRIRRALDGEDISGAEARTLVSDPYAIAYLRDGPIEALRVALMSLTDRGLIFHDAGTFATAEGVELQHGRRPIERAVLGHFVTRGEAKSLATLKSACDPYEGQLQRVRLLPDAELRVRRFWLLLAVMLLLGGVAVTKIVIGISRGRPVAFLIILGALMTLIGIGVANPRRTKHGDAFLDGVKRLFEGLKNRASTIQPGGATADLALLAAAFGVTSVPSSAFPHVRSLFPPEQTSSSSSSSGCGSSSSCGSSGCGGGGCGGCGGGD